VRMGIPVDGIRRGVTRVLTGLQIVPANAVHGHAKTCTVQYLLIYQIVIHTTVKPGDNMPTEIQIVIPAVVTVQRWHVYIVKITRRTNLTQGPKLHDDALHAGALVPNLVGRRPRTCDNLVVTGTTISLCRPVFVSQLNI